MRKTHLDEYWFTSEDGIRKHFADERETLVRLHGEAIQRLDKLENDMVDALAASRAKVQGK